MDRDIAKVLWDCLAKGIVTENLCQRLMLKKANDLTGLGVYSPVRHFADLP